MHLFRFHIRPSGGTASMEVTFNYCVNNHLLGVGWRTETNENTKDWDTYFSEAIAIHGKLKVCEYIFDEVQENDLIWTRDSKGQYYLARVRSGWEYWVSEESLEQNIDIGNIVRCDFQKIEIDEVPGKVIACFRPTRSVQKITHPATLEFSKHLWNMKSGENVYEIDTNSLPDIFTMLDDQETEDLIFLYLQSQGWFVVPNSRKADTIAFEFLLVRRDDHARAQVQVKTGQAALDCGDYANVPHTVFLFQSEERYIGTRGDNTKCIKREELLYFLNVSTGWLPHVYAHKMQMI